VQVRIFGVSVLVGAWWLDAAARGIPPTIPVVNFNTTVRPAGLLESRAQAGHGVCHRTHEDGTTPRGSRADLRAQDCCL
jgi:hypothetical protein